MTQLINADARLESLKTFGVVSYILHLIVAIGAVLPSLQPSVVLLLVALAIDLLKRDDARGTWTESHYAYRLRTVIWAGVLYLITAPLWILLIVPGWIAWVLISLWFLYRIVKGMLRHSAAQPVV
ncbi:MAG: hypothetical protein N2688_13255 [Burkholderiaceae bacterium]|nr:hypothetical protein [Burkholderiaceae bacterium]